MRPTAKLFSRKTNAKREAFEAEAMPHLESLYLAARRLTRSETEADDLVQDTMLKAYRFFDRFEPGTNMRAWLLKIQTNSYINRYRRRLRERAFREGEDARPVSESMMSRGAIRALSNPLDEAQRRMLAAAIQEALDSLNESQRMLIVLADLEELAYKEIAEILGCPVGTVMSRLHRARKAMQAHLIDHAIDLGIVEPVQENEVSAAHDEGADAPVSLEAYRMAREGAQ
ncbi:MAG: sigma-70 family RNA polymerase sigma factor [Sandaracinaceae bacterium]|nr:sigma-70 family RNA polymerase sigma factor [Sandaracinaceae bacterium]